MKLDINLFGELERIRKSINAQKANVGIFREKKQSFSKNPFEIELLEKGDLELSGTELEENVVYPAGLAAIGNTQVTLHILQAIINIETFLEETKEEPTSSTPKIHVCDCRTLQQMRERGRYNRYIATQRQFNGYTLQPSDRKTKELLINAISAENYSEGMKKALTFFKDDNETGKMKMKLQICKNCLDFLNYEEFSDSPRSKKNDIFESFDLENFFENYKHIFRCLPLYNEKNFPEGDYTSDWAKISEEFRRNANWTCSCCQVQLSKRRGLLHVHHKDGIRGNNKPSNLEVLCAICHSKKPYHSSMFIKKEEKENIHNFRNEQDLQKQCKECMS